MPFIKRYPVLVSLALYLVACFSPALIFHIRHDLGPGGFVWGGYRTLLGYELLGGGLLLGWIRLNFTAFANPLLWIAWILFARRSYAGARLFSGLALILSLETLQLVFQPYLWDEGASDKGFLIAPHIGCILWVLSMTIIFWQGKR